MKTCQIRLKVTQLLSILNQWQNWQWDFFGPFFWNTFKRVGYFKKGLRRYKIFSLRFVVILKHWSDVCFQGFLYWFQQPMSRDGLTNLAVNLLQNKVCQMWEWPELRIMISANVHKLVLISELVNPVFLQERYIKYWVSTLTRS